MTGPKPVNIGELLARLASAQRRVRKPSLSRALSEAKKAGEHVKGVTITADGAIALTFAEPEAPKASDLDRWMYKHADQTKGH
jgi:hypothetical protein